RRFSLLRDVHRRLRDQESRLDIPEPLLWIDDVSTMWVSDWNGGPLMTALQSSDGDTPVRSAAQAVAALHTSRLEGLDQGPDPGRAAEIVAADTTHLARTLPEISGLVERLRRRLEARRDAARANDTPVVPIHGACRIEQMLALGSRVTLIDFDALAAGDPLQDVAEFIASLEFLSIRDGLTREPVERRSAAFLDEYAGAVSWPVDRARVAWYVLAYLATKMSSVVKHLD